MKAFLFASIFSLAISTNAFASNGVVYEEGGGLGYINQGSALQIKALINYYADASQSYADLEAMKLSAVYDVTDIEGEKVYAGLGIWDFMQTSNFLTYQTRFDAIVGVRHTFNEHLQVEIFVNVFSLANGETINLYVDSNGAQHTKTGAGGFSVGRTGAVALSYFF